MRNFWWNWGELNVAPPPAAGSLSIGASAPLVFPRFARSGHLQQVRGVSPLTIPSVQFPNQKHISRAGVFLVELGGIEPPSGKSSHNVSPSSFPLGYRRAVKAGPNPRDGAGRNS